MRNFKHLWLPVLSTIILGGAACRDRDDGYTREKPVEVEKNDRVDVNDDGEFVRVRERDNSELRARLSRLDDKIAELRARGSEEASQTADKLKATRDDLAARLDRAGEQTSSSWDAFKKDVGDAFDKAEHEIDDALD